MTTSSKIPATDRSAGGPDSSHVDRNKAPEDSGGARHQHNPAVHKHPADQTSTGAGGTKHEKREPGEGRRG